MSELVKVDDGEPVPLWALDMAAKAQLMPDWAYLSVIQCDYRDELRNGAIAHARTLTKYEKKPVDEDELKRRQDARNLAAKVAVGCSSFNVIEGKADTLWFVQSAYLMACLKDGVEPVPVSEWSDK